MKHNMILLCTILFFLAAIHEILTLFIKLLVNLMKIIRYLGKAKNKV
jgi:hypothetical protein